ncbi:HEAT repeat domain-containing protein [Streptomyces otsuchiensis]|uniref:HEAT repeat domain-containing protein n=1 Tax=Streptomyces otsuchiensis TaxID=2681388 RepID=UPI00102F6526|nr:HEAT repeat domain-containing protein [Streptomyces otsuchiensis]
MFASPVETDIAPSGTLLGLLQRGRGDGALHALAAPRPEAVAALERCVLHDPRRDWQLEHRSLYYARLYVELRAGLAAVEAHLFHPEDGLAGDGLSAADVPEDRTGLALSVLGHLVSYGDQEALGLLRRYAATGANWRWALDELAVRDDDSALRDLGPAILARFPHTDEGRAALGRTVRDAYEPRPWRIWAEDPDRPEQGERIAGAREDGDFGRWRRQLRSPGPRPGWGVAAVLDWVRDGYDEEPRIWREAPAARCLAAVTTPEDRPVLLEAARTGGPAVRAAALRHLAEREETAALGLLEAAADDPEPELAASAVASFARMLGPGALSQARRWAERTDLLGSAASAVLARRGDSGDAPAVLAALRRTVRLRGTDAEELYPLVEGAGRLTLRAAAPVLRHIYRETASSHLRGRTAVALEATDPFFAAGFAVECLWDCEEDTREVAARAATSGDARVAERLRRLATDPAERDGVQTAVRGRLGGV